MYAAPGPAAFLDSIQGAIADVTVNAGQPAGVLKLSAPPGFGIGYLLPLMPAFLARYPAVTPDLLLDNRPLDLIVDGFDAAIGGGFDLTPGMVARELASIHLIAVASPAFLRGKQAPKDPAGLAELAGITMRSPLSSRIRQDPRPEKRLTLSGVTAPTHAAPASGG